MKLKFETDSHFLIGRMHINSGKPCQDYALAGVLDSGDAAYAIVADGCSSGRHTELGASVLTFATARAIQAQWISTKNSVGKNVPEEVAFYQQIGTEGVKTTLGLGQIDLLATCVYAFVSSMGGFIHIQGDGVIAYKLKSGSVFMVRYEWANNAPCYPAYAVDNFQNYINAQGGDVNAIAMTSQIIILHDNKSPQTHEGKKIPLGVGVRGVSIEFNAEQLADIEYIAVFSDGVTQVEGIVWHEVVNQLLSFKTTSGGFVTRRLIRAVRDSEKIGKGPIDDIACAVIKVSLPQPTDTNANQVPETA